MKVVFTKEQKMKRFVKEYAKYSIDTLKHNELMDKDIKAHAIAKIEKAVKFYECSMITADEAIKLILKKFSD